METNRSAGHLTALLTILIWGTTFTSTKILLGAFAPVEILFLRFLLGLAALTILFPRRLRGTNSRQETVFAAAGLCGICLYYLLENIALTYTLAANASVIVSSAPFFTALLSRVCFPAEERLHPGFFAGFAAAMAGLILINFGGAQVHLNPMGDLLALLAAVVWAFYSVLTRKIASFGYPTILVTRRIFFYGLLWMLPALLFFRFHPDLTLLARPVYLGNLVYLGLGASALCFVTWNFSVKTLGTVKTSVYIYLVPVITIVASAVVLHETLSPSAIAGTALTLTGLFFSQKKGAKRTKEKKTS